MIDGNELVALRPDDLDSLAELLMNVTIELAAIDERLTRLEQAGDSSADTSGLRSDVAALFGRLLPGR